MRYRDFNLKHFGAVDMLSLSSENALNRFRSKHERESIFPHPHYACMRAWERRKKDSKKGNLLLPHSRARARGERKKKTRGERESTEGEKFFSSSRTHARVREETRERRRGREEFLPLTCTCIRARGDKRYRRTESFFRPLSLTAVEEEEWLQRKKKEREEDEGRKERERGETSPFPLQYARRRGGKMRRGRGGISSSNMGVGKERRGKSPPLPYARMRKERESDSGKRI